MSHLPPPVLTTPELDALRDEAAAVRASGSLGQSSTTLRLFDFLLEQSLAGRSPKEIEIAHAVFTRSTQFSPTEDATVRVNVHRLRRKIEDHYLRRKGEDGPKLSLPRGEYRLTLASLIAPPAADVPGPSRRKLGLMIGAGLAAIAIVNIAAWTVLTWPSAAERNLESLRTGALWGPLTENARPTSLVVGDYYVFGDSENGSKIDRLIRDFSINSSEDLDHLLMANPDFIGHHVDVGMHFTPTAVAPALQKLLPIITLPREDWRKPRTLAMSETTPDRIKLSNIVYVGFLNSLGPLEAPIARASSLGATGAGVDLHAKVLQMREAGVEKTSGEDVAYVATLPGPNGNQIVVVAGYRDAGLQQAAEIAASPQMIGDLSRRVKGAEAFEALYYVGSMNTTNVGARLIYAGPLDRNKLWTPTTP